MSDLDLFLFGSFRVMKNGQPVKGFDSDKVRALLSYLVVEIDQPHRREALAGLFWPDLPEQRARNNLRGALANLRQVILDDQETPPFLLITPQTIQFNHLSGFSLDVERFNGLMSTPTTRSLEAAVALYQGAFLDGFSLPDSSVFEEWALLEREHLNRQMLAALRQLARQYEQVGNYDQAIAHLWRHVGLEPWDEEAQRQLMRLLALTGQRTEALVQYKACERTLAEELGVQPASETIQLFHRIRDGLLAAPSPGPKERAQLPEFLQKTPLQSSSGPQVFVGRQAELSWLEDHLKHSLSGEGRVALVAGEAGQGKSALIQAFLYRIRDTYPDLLAVMGHCNAYLGQGDPYLPFREILYDLTGDMEIAWLAGAIDRAEVARRWQLLPDAFQALITYGPDLIHTFVPGAQLLNRAKAYLNGKSAAWLEALHELAARKISNQPAENVPQMDLFSQYTRFLQVMAQKTPLILVLEDLQWADAGTASLLFHLGHQLKGYPIFIICALRLDEITVPGSSTSHPLGGLIPEFQRTFGDMMLDLDAPVTSEFTNNLVDIQPNRLEKDFRSLLHHHTGGHPLFTLELLHSLQERGELVLDEDGCWVTAYRVHWDLLPPRIEAVIAERMRRLPAQLRAILETASIEGETFTAEVVARIRGIDDRQVVQQLSEDLDRIDRLVIPVDVQRVNEQVHSHFRFRHILFQRYLYHALTEAERTYLHQAAGNILETMVAGCTEEFALALARHFQCAHMAAKAVLYLQQAGGRAWRLSAIEESILHFQRALELLLTLPETPERDQKELALQMDLGGVLEMSRGFTAPEAETAHSRAYDLCQQLGDNTQIAPVLWRLGSDLLCRGEHRKALVLSQPLLSLAQQSGDPIQMAMVAWGVGTTQLHAGNLHEARELLQKTIDFYDPQRHHDLVYIYRQDPGVSALAWIAWTHWFLGYPDQASVYSQRALALAHKLKHPFTLGFAMIIAGALFHQLGREVPMAELYHSASLKLSQEKGFQLYQLVGTIFQGWLRATLRREEAAIDSMRQDLMICQNMGSGSEYTHLLSLLAEAYGKNDQPAKGLAVIAEALTFGEAGGECYYKAELLRLQGELLLAAGADASEAEACFRHAIDVARGQSAKMWELRATLSLSRLLRQQGKSTESHDELGEVYDWFTEGFNTIDLQEAKKFLSNRT